MLRQIAVSVLLVATIGCGFVSPDAGQEAVLIKKPMLFGHGGVDTEPVKTGLTFTALTTSSVTVEVRPIQFPLHFEDAMTKDGVPVDFDATIRLQVTDSVTLIKNFGEKWYENNIQREFQEAIRSAVKKHGMNETAIDNSAIEEIDSEITNRLEKYIESAKLPVKLIQVTMGKANPPDAIKNQRIETASQQQRIISEQQRKLAEDSRLNAERSRAEADNAYRNSLGLSPSQFIQLEVIRAQRDICTHNKCTFVAPGSSVIVNPN